MKKILSTFLALVLSVNFFIPAHASNIASINQEIIYKPYSDSVTTPEEQERIEREYFAAHPEIAAAAGVADYVIVDNGAIITPYGQDPGNGSVRIATGNMFGLGTIYWDTIEKASALSTIAGVMMDILGKKVGTVISVVGRILGFYGITTAPDLSRSGEVKTGHSVTYVNKTGDFYYNSVWQIAVTIQKRFFFQHSYANVSVNGVPAQYVFDETPAAGYPAYLTEAKPNFDNNTYISNLTLQKYNDRRTLGYFTPFKDAWF